MGSNFWRDEKGIRERLWTEPQNALYKKSQITHLVNIFLDFGFLQSLKAFYQIGTFLKLNYLFKEHWRHVPFNLRSKLSYFLALVRSKILQALVTSVKILCHQKSMQKTLDIYLCEVEMTAATHSDQCPLLALLSRPMSETPQEATVMWKESTSLFPASSQARVCMPRV